MKTDDIDRFSTNHNRFGAHGWRNGKRISLAGGFWKGKWVLLLSEEGEGEKTVLKETEFSSEAECLDAFRRRSKDLFRNRIVW